MEVSFLSILALGFVLGIKHAIEPDHIIAVSTIASETKKLSKSSLAGVFWGIGHTATLFVVGMFIILLKGDIPEIWSMSLEFSVGIMLVYLGTTSMISAKLHRREDHSHVHDRKGVSYVKSMTIGLVHGLAGSAAMILLTMSTVNSALEGAFYILIFGAGTVIGMLLFTTMIGIPFVFSANKVKLNTKLTQVTGFISTAFGFYYMYNLGVVEGLFKLWTNSL